MIPLLVWAVVIPLAADRQDPPANSPLAIRLADLKRLADDATLSIGQRESAVMEMAGVLDESAKGTGSPEERALLWNRAIAVLAGFNDENAGHPRSHEFQLQVAVYRWAQGESWRQYRSLYPTDDKARKEAVAALDDAIARLRAITSAEGEAALSDNVRFRLARALTDRAGLEEPGAHPRRLLEGEALQWTAPAPSEVGLKGFSHLLRADLLRRAGRLDEADADIAAAAGLSPPPPPRDLLVARLLVLTDRHKWSEAEAQIKASRVDDAVKAAALARLGLAQLSGMPAGDARYAIEQELFRELEGLRSKKNPEARQVLAALGAEDLNPDARHPASAWDLLADAAQVRGDPARAAELEDRAADRAVHAGDHAAAAGYRLKAGAILFEAGRYADAGAVCARVAADPRAGPAGPRAGLLVALARGRALASGARGVTAASYAEALEKQVRDFPKDPSTDEARWLLALLSRAAGDHPRARSLWDAIPVGSTRWLDARLALADLDVADLEALLATADRPILKESFDRARKHLEEGLKLARTDAERAAFLLADARINLVPVVGNPRTALERLDRITALPMRAADRYRARLLRLVATVQTGPPYLQAEREAQAHSTWAEASAHAPFFEAVRLLDECASNAEEALHERRLGLVIRFLVQPMVQDGDEDKWTPSERAELRMRLVRSHLFLGDERGARAAFRSSAGPPRDASDSMLRDLADTYNRLEAFELAIDVERLRSKTLQPGSPAWFETRYGLALAYFRAGQLADAAQLINATAILHPNLGGGAIEQKFIRLRHRIGAQH
ncbi:hypothetical protein [Aquisphaera insulae]|uniref:hypothetical protein n=1 Tax=Aquisphaera insulae TaxID=2712864 RepID=UPI0013EA809A|nr:hypothetical protein [Aquisphaera insulae]